MFEPNVTSVMWFAEAPELEVIVQAFKKHLWSSHRVSSCIEGREFVARHAEMDQAYHFTERHVSTEAEIEALALELQLSPMDRTHPLWKVVVARARAPQRSAVILNFHHALGDGLGLLFLFSNTMGVEGGNPMSKIPLPNTVLPPSARKPPSNKPSPAAKPSGLVGCLAGIFRLPCQIMYNIKQCLRGALTPLVTTHDTELSINEPLAKRTPILPFNNRRAYTRFPAVPMSAVQAARKRRGISMNDAVMSALTGALRRYALDIRGDKVLAKEGSRVEFKSLVMLALPRRIDETDLTKSLVNNILFTSSPLPIDEHTVAGRVRRTVQGCDDLKSKAYMTGLIGFTKFITKVAPQSLLNKAAGETWSKHSLCVTNVPATSCEMTWPAEGGKPVGEISVVIANVMPQVSLVSYNGNLYAGLVADPELMPDPTALGRLWVSEFEALASEDH